MVHVDAALMLLQAERSKSDLEVQLLTDQVKALGYVVDVYDARAEGREIPAAPEKSAPLATTPAVLAQDRITKAFPTYTHDDAPFEMMPVMHVRRFIQAERARALHIARPLKEKLAQIRREIDVFIQSGELK